jgi:hypothetical protein
MPRRIQASVVHQDGRVKIPLFRSSVGRELDAQGAEDLSRARGARLDARQLAAKLPLKLMTFTQGFVDVFHVTKMTRAAGRSSVQQVRRFVDFIDASL